MYSCQEKLQVGPSCEDGLVGPIERGSSVSSFPVAGVGYRARTSEIYESGHGLMLERIVHDARGPSALRAWQYAASDKARKAREPFCRGAPKILGNDS
jgi:hypothetical protein